MVGTAIICLLVLGAVISWNKQLPRGDESWAAMSSKRKVLSILGIPVGLVVAGLGVRLVIAASDAGDFYETLTLVTMVILAGGGLVLAGLTAVKLTRVSR